MIEGSVFVILVQFAFPLLLSNLLQQLYNLVDMIIVGRVVGTNGTVGVSTGGEIAALITFVAISFGTTGQVCAAQMVVWGDGTR